MLKNTILEIIEREYYKDGYIHPTIQNDSFMNLTLSHSVSIGLECNR